MSAVAVRQMADRVAALMEERLHVRGATLEEKLEHGARLLPRRVREEARYVAQNAALARNAETLEQVDHERLAEAYNACIFHLRRIDYWGRIRRRAVVLAGALLSGVLAGGIILLLLLWWRGFL